MLPCKAAPSSVAQSLKEKDMRRFRILNAEPLGYCDEARTVLNQVGDLVEASLNRFELLSQLPNYDVLIIRLAHQINREIIDAGHGLKAIVTATTGLDHIDIDYAHSKGIAVLSLRGETDFLRTVSATAEHTWALLLALSRRIPHAYAAVQRGEWCRDAFRGHELDGKRLGLVGLGRVGCKVARYGLAFGMAVAAYDPYATGWVDGVAHCQTLAELLSQSDVLSMHVPLNDETAGMLGADELALLPQGAMLINTSRGEVVDEKALVQAIEVGHLVGAALDVVTHEREPEQRRCNPLLAYVCTRDNLIITPHIAGATHESMAKTEVFMAHKLLSFLESL
jgi:D-3-phosphoglycerate dehydrogenase